MRKTCFSWGSICLFTALVATGFAEPVDEAEPVDQFGDLSCMIIQGLDSFDPEQVKRSLSGDVQAVLAAHPRAPLSGLAPVLRQRLLEGLLAAGRAESEVTVAVNRDDMCMQAMVREGPVYRCGEIRVVGADDFPVSELIERLTSPYPPSNAVKPKFLVGDEQQIVAWLDRDGKEVSLESAPWVTGKPAPLAEGSRKGLQRKVKLALEDIGYHAADFDVQVVADRSSQSADLVVQLRDTGRPAVLQEIEIAGNEISSRDAIVQYLDLPMGSRLDRRQLIRINYALWLSGRFIKHDVTTEAWSGGKRKLRIEVVESPFALAIDRPLSRAQKVLLKTGRWLANSDAWQGDLVLSVKAADDEAAVILSPREGMVGSVQSRPDGTPCSATFLGGSDVVGFYPDNLPIKLEATTPGVRLYFTMKLSLQQQPTEEDKPFSLQMKFGFHKGAELDDIPFLEATVAVEPVAAVAMAVARNAKVDWDGDVMILTNAVEHVEIDARTGRLLRYHDPSDPEALQVRFEQGAFDRRRREIVDATADLTNAFATERPVSSLLEFFTRKDVLRAADLKWNDVDARQVQLVHRLIELGTLQPLDDWVCSDHAEPEEKFDIPTGIQPPNWQVGLALAAVPLADQLYARGSWLWTVWRESALTMAGQGQYTGQELEFLFYTDDVGPLCHLAVASLLERVKPEMSHAFAARGLELREPGDFRKDIQPLLDTHSVTGRCLLRAGRILAAMERSELAQFTASLPEPWPDCLETLRSELRRRDDKAIEVALPAALESSWSRGLQDVVETACRDLRDRTGSR